MRALRTVARRSAREGGLGAEDLARNPRLDFLVSSDFHRVDLALVVRRKPIYFAFDDIEFRNAELEHKLRWKHDLYPLVNRELLEVSLAEQARPAARAEVTPLYKRMPDGGKYYYRAESTAFNEISPRVRALTSVQRQPTRSVYFLCRRDGRWAFPSQPARVDESLSLGKERVMRALGGAEWGASFTGRYPLTARREPFLERDRENPYWLKCAARKVFYFEALHEWGVGALPAAFGGEYVWAAKHELNRFLAREDFAFFHALLEAAD